MKAAFQPYMAIMRSLQQGEYRGRTGTLSIPSELKGIVTGVFGLDERRLARPKASAVAKASRTASLAPLTPADLEHRYNFPAGDGAGQTIAVAEFGGGYFSEDLISFCRRMRRPVPLINTVSVDAPAYTLQQIIALPPLDRKEEVGAKRRSHGGFRNRRRSLSQVHTKIFQVPVLLY